jgi:hypothetical protein
MTVAGPIVLTNGASRCKSTFGLRVDHWWCVGRWLPNGTGDHLGFIPDNFSSLQHRVAAASLRLVLTGAAKDALVKDRPRVRD